jgi:hypothetical protein
MRIVNPSFGTATRPRKPLAVNWATDESPWCRTCRTPASFYWHPQRANRKIDNIDFLSKNASQLPADALERSPPTTKLRR